MDGQHGWHAVYFKETDADEKTVRFWQEIYNGKGELVEKHEKFPEDKGHQKIMVTKHSVAVKIHNYLNHTIELAELVDWCENVIMEGEIVEQDTELISEVVARIGVADVNNFGLLWKECDELLRKLGYQLDFDLKKVA